MSATIATTPSPRRKHYFNDTTVITVLLPNGEYGAYREDEGSKAADARLWPLQVRCDRRSCRVDRRWRVVEIVVRKWRLRSSGEAA